MRTPGKGKDLLMLFVLLCLKGMQLNAQQFPIGTFWVRDPNGRERHDQYAQVASCGMNIIVGGTNAHSDPLRIILDAADSNNIQILINNASVENLVGKYACKVNSRTPCYRILYETAGYQSFPEIPALEKIEEILLYSFDREIGEQKHDPDARDSMAIHVSSGPSGYLLHEFHGTNWQEQGRKYWITFRLKISGDITQPVPVARLEVVQDGTILNFQTIRCNDFLYNNRYQDFEFDFTARSAVDPGEKNDQPKHSAQSSTEADLDYRVYWEGRVPLWVDYIVVENKMADELWDSPDIQQRIENEARNVIAQDPDHDTILGFYVDEPYYCNMRTIEFVNSIIDSIPVVACLTGLREYLYYQYLLAGDAANRDTKLLTDIYPFFAADPDSSDPNYNLFLQTCWENQLISDLEKAQLASSLFNRPFWYAVQAHRWDYRRGPSKAEIRAMVNLALAHGARGIFYFLYASIDARKVGLVDVDFNPNSKWHEVRRINENLQLIGNDLLSLNWLSAFTSGDSIPANSIVQSISRGGDIEIGNFIHATSGESYFMLVNRRCRDEDTQSIDVILQDSGNHRVVEDVLAGRKPRDSDVNHIVYRRLEAHENSITVILQPGEGRLFCVVEK